MENKKDFVAELGELLNKYSREEIKSLKYIKKNEAFNNAETVSIYFSNGEKKIIDVSANSNVGIMYDVARAIMF